MKKVFLGFTFLTLISFASYSQDIRFGFQAGTAIASQKAKSSGINISSDSKFSVTAGLLADIPVTGAVSFQPALNFTQKGSKMNITQDGFSVKSTQTLNYLELPLNVLYNGTAGSGKFFGGLGPVLSYGLSGKSTYEESGEPKVSEDVKFGSNKDEDHYKPFELGGNILAGYEFSNGVFVAASYFAGLSNIAVDNSDNTSVKNNYFGIRLGYKLAGKK